MNALRLSALALASTVAPALQAQDCSPEAYGRYVGDHNGACVHTSGRGGAVHIADSANPPLTEMTVEVFFKADWLPGTARLISCKSPTSNGGWAMSLVDGRLRFEYFTGLAVEASEPIVTGTWYRAVANVNVEYSTLAMNLYLGASTDDVLLSVADAWGPTPAGPTTGGLHLMADPNGSNRFFGAVEEARVFSRALGGATIGYMATPGMGRRFESSFNWAAYTILHFTEGSGSTIADASGHGRNGSLFSASWLPLYTDADWNGVLDACQTPCMRWENGNPTLCRGDSTTLVIGEHCTGQAGVGRQWMKNGQDIPGATGWTYDIPSATHTDEGVYAVRGWNWLNPSLVMISDPLTVTVTDPPPQPPVATLSRTDVCDGIGTIVLEAPGMEGPVDFDLEWRAGSCDGPVIGAGARLEIPVPRQDTAYFVRAVGRCGTTPCTATPIVHVHRTIGGVDSINDNGALTRVPGPPLRKMVASNFGLGLTEDGSILPIMSGQYRIDPPPQGPFIDIGCSEVCAFAIRPDGTGVGWSATNSGETNVPAGRWRSLSGGIYWAVGVRDDGTLAAWGLDQANAGVLHPPAGTYLTATGSGFGIGLAIRTDGTLVSWGDPPFQRNTLNVPSGTFTKLAATTSYAMALRTDGEVVAWSSDPSSAGFLNPPPGPFVDLAAGTWYAAAQRPDGRWVAWGPGQSVAPPLDQPIRALALMRQGCTLTTASWPILSQPSSVEARPGEEVALSVQLDPTAELTEVRWRRDGVVIPGAAGPTLRFTASPDAAGRYECEVLAGCGRVLSYPAQVTLDCPADFNQDGFTDFFDYDAFVSAFEAGDPAADFNLDSFLDFFDYDDFVQAFEQGC